jgi:hypothetical protein
MRPVTRYAKSGDVHIAYQVTGEGPLDLVFVPGFVSHLVAGSGLRFQDRGRQALKGVPDEWHLFALEREASPA